MSDNTPFIWPDYFREAAPESIAALERSVTEQGLRGLVEKLLELNVETSPVENYPAFFSAAKVYGLETDFRERVRKNKPRYVGSQVWWWFDARKPALFVWVAMLSYDAWRNEHWAEAIRSEIIAWINTCHGFYRRYANDVGRGILYGAPGARLFIEPPMSATAWKEFSAHKAFPLGHYLKHPPASLSPALLAELGVASA